MAIELPDFWNETTDVAIARKLRLAVVQNCLDGGLISEQGAREILAGPLTPGDPATVYDDSRWLNVIKELLAAQHQLQPTNAPTVESANTSPDRGIRD